MNQEKIRQLQDCQFGMMKIVHDICIKFDIEYYIIGGTLLGSVRHMGFIPWDVDIDIAMTRPNYVKFKEIAHNSLPLQMNYKDYTSEPEFRPPHAIVEWKDSYLIISKNNHKTKIFIDIFPLDYAPNEIKLQKGQAKRIKYLKFIKACKMLSKSNKLNVNPIKKVAFWLFRFFNLFINIKKINIRMQEIMQMYNNISYDAEFLCSMASHYSYEKQCMPKGIYGKPTLMTFRDTEFYGPEKSHEYLTRIYGRYMEMPSKELQERYMDSFTDAGCIN